MARMSLLNFHWITISWRSVLETHNGNGLAGFNGFCNLQPFFISKPFRYAEPGKHAQRFSKRSVVEPLQ
jgi:hypothetical protein